MFTDHLVQVYNFLFQELSERIIYYGKRKITVWSALCGGKMKDQPQSSLIETETHLYKVS